MYILNFLRGFCMVLAGVPGVIIAFISGFYHDFVNLLNNIVSSDKLGRINAIKL